MYVERKQLVAPGEILAEGKYVSGDNTHRDGDKVFSSQLNVVLDPRARYSVEDKRAQFDLVSKLAEQLNHMSWAVDAIIAARESATAAQLPDLAAAIDKIRTKIVATKEGGAITGEERLREYLAGLYGDVNGYEGRPTDSQVARTDALARELEDVIAEFRALVAKSAKPIPVLSEADWKKSHE